MKHTFWMSGLFLLLFIAAPRQGYPAIAKPITAAASSIKQETIAEGKTRKRLTFREKATKKFGKAKEKIRQWWEAVQLSFPSGKLLTSLVLLGLSITFLIVAGLTIYGGLFNALASVAVIGAVVFFVLWLTERSKTPGLSYKKREQGQKP
jgi:Flp pilus assembly protein TadB